MKYDSVLLFVIKFVHLLVIGAVSDYGIIAECDHCRYLCEGLYNWLMSALSRADSFLTEYENATSECCQCCLAQLSTVSFNPVTLLRYITSYPQFLWCFVGFSFPWLSFLFPTFVCWPVVRKILI
jgi:hypothetical protein